jgi:hypothetical protein
VQIANGNVCGIEEGLPGAWNQANQKVTPAGHAFDKIAFSSTFKVGNYVRVLRRQPDLVAFAIDPFAWRGSGVPLIQPGPVEPARHLPIARLGRRPEMKPLWYALHSAFDAANFLILSISSLELHSKWFRATGALRYWLAKAYAWGIRPRRVARKLLKHMPLA